MADFQKLRDMRLKLYAMSDWTANGIAEPPERTAYIKRHKLDEIEIEARAGIFAVTLCSFPGISSLTGQPFFQFSEDGVPSAVIEVLDEDGETVIDLVAWPLLEPAAFATAIGNSDILGASNMRIKTRNPLQIHSTALAWLKAGCTGCVIVNPSFAGCWFGKFCQRDLIVEDLSHGLEVEKILKHRLSDKAFIPPFDMKKLLVPMQQKARAA